MIHTNYTFHIFAVFNTHHIFNDENKKTIRQYEIMINTLTSLRFIFAIMVFGAHCYVIDNVFNTHFFKEGFVGVSFFFVLSGFIIAYNYQEKLKDNKIDKRTFWVARIARIYPLHWLTLFIAAILGSYVSYRYF